MRAQLRQRLDGLQRRGRHVLEFVGDDVALARERRQRGKIIVGGVDFLVRHGTGRAIGLRLVDVHAVTETRRRLREHAAELAAAEHADGFSRENHRINHKVHEGHEGQTRKSCFVIFVSFVGRN